MIIWDVAVHLWALIIVEVPSMILNHNIQPDRCKLLYKWPHVDLNTNNFHSFRSEHLFKQQKVPYLRYAAPTQSEAIEAQVAMAKFAVYIYMYKYNVYIRTGFSPEKLSRAAWCMRSRYRGGLVVLPPPEKSFKGVSKIDSNVI